MKIRIEIMTNKEKADNYLIWFSHHYQELKGKYAKFCKENNYEWDEDIFSDTYLKIYDCIIKNGIKDDTPHGMSGYTFMSFKNNIRNEQRYCRSRLRDKNISSDNINDLYESWYNKTQDSSRVKLEHDLFQDFSILYIMLRVEERFDPEYVYLYKVKTLTKGMTFKKLQTEHKNIKSTRKKVIDVQNWVKNNITKEEIRKEFNELYGDLIGN